MALVLSPALTFIGDSLNRSTADDVYKACESFYTSDELVEAKGTLWEHGPSELLGENIKRKKSAKVLHDIIGGIQKLDAANKLPKFVVDAEGLNRIPSSKTAAPVGPPVHLERLDSMDRFLREELGRLSSRIRRLEDDHTHPKIVDPCPPSSQPAHLSYAAVAANAVVPMQRASGGVPRPTGSNYPKRGGGNPEADDAYTEVRNKRRPHIIRCTGQAGVVRGAREPSRDGHVFRCEPDVEEHHIKEHMEAKSIVPRAVEKVSKETSVFHSFRVEVTLSQMSQVMTPDFWPDGVCVKRYYQPRRVTTTGTIGDERRVSSSSNHEK
jgi:hypothetical protein